MSELDATSARKLRTWRRSFRAIHLTITGAAFFWVLFSLIAYLFGGPREAPGRHAGAYTTKQCRSRLRLLTADFRSEVFKTQRLLLKLKRDPRTEWSNFHKSFQPRWHNLATACFSSDTPNLHHSLLRGVHTKLGRLATTYGEQLGSLVDGFLRQLRDLERQLKAASTG